MNRNVASNYDISLADKMLENYHELNESLYGREEQTFTNHALIHLANQRREHGCPIILLSNFVFKGFIGSMKRQGHGSKNIVHQMVNNISILQNVSNIVNHVEDTSIRDFAKLVAFGKKSVKREISPGLFVYGSLMNSQPKIPRTPQFEEDDSSFYCDRIWYKGNVYHSLAYRYRRESNSFTVTFNNGRAKQYGKIIFFVKRADTCVMMIKLMQRTPVKLYNAEFEGILNADVDQFIRNSELGSGFVNLIESDNYLEVPVFDLIGRMFLVSDENGGWWASNILNSYQHD